MNTWARPPQPPVDLVRSQVNMPLEPGRVVNDDEGHRSLGSGEEIAKDPGRGVAEVDLPSGAETSEAELTYDIPMFSRSSGLEPEAVQGVIDWMHKGAAVSDAEIPNIDARDMQAATTELQALWGSKYESNLEAVAGYVRALPEAQRDFFLKARDHRTGKALLNDTRVLVGIAGLARAPQPQVKGGGAVTIESIERLLRTNRAAYNKDIALQQQYRNLLDQRERANRGS